MAAQFGQPVEGFAVDQRLQVAADQDVGRRCALRVARNPEDVLKSLLAKAFHAAVKEGKSELNIDIAAIKAQLPAEMQHIPIYLDHKLYEQRREVEARHNVQASGVEEFFERFAAGGADGLPGPVITGNTLTATPGIAPEKTR